MIKNTRTFTSDFEMNGPFESSFYNEKLWGYFRKIWDDSADYKVLIARRMFNLNEALMSEWNKNNKEQYYRDGIMSNIAFLLSAKDIADRYARRLSFPRIIICDDIMLHGRGISTLLARFRKIVRDRLKEQGVEISEEQLDFDLRNAIRVFLFARNKDDSLLIDKTKYRLYTTLVLPVNFLRELSYYISLYLLNTGIPNTSYVASAKLTWRQWNIIKSVEDLDSDDAFEYMQKRRNVFFRRRSPHILETMRLYYPYDNPKLGYILTSLPIFADTSNDSLSELCNVIAGVIGSNHQYNHVLKILCQSEPELIKPKAQFLSFLYSVLSIADFLRQYLYLEDDELYKTIISGDIDKIIINFNNALVFRHEILSLIREICTDQSIGKLLWDSVVSIAGDSYESKKTDDTILLFRHIQGPRKEQRARISNKAEDIFYEIGMKAEIEANDHIRHIKPFDAIDSAVDRISFDDYLLRMGENNRNYSVGFAFGLMDSGLVAMNQETITVSGQLKVQTVLKAGEMATYILPRRFSIFIPAFAKVERYCGGVYKKPQDIIRAFIQYLQDHPYRQGGKTDPRDVALMVSLIEAEDSLLKLYDAGHRFKDWDIDLKLYSTSTSNGTHDDGKMTAKEEWARQRHYLVAAMMFVDTVVEKDMLVNT